MYISSENFLFLASVFFANGSDKIFNFPKRLKFIKAKIYKKQCYLHKTRNLLQLYWNGLSWKVWKNFNIEEKIKACYNSIFLT